MKKPNLIWVFLLTTLLLFIDTSFAETTPTETTPIETTPIEIVPVENVEVAEQGWTFIIENDRFALKNATDRWYTNGFQFTTAFKRNYEPESLKWIKNLVSPLLINPNTCHQLGCDLTLVATFGQNMYTPRRIDIEEPQLQDRPWAGWLYGGIGASVYNGNRHEFLSLKIGPIGPASLAEETQKFVHCCIVNSQEPKGWKNQLRPRLGTQISYLSTYRFKAMKNLGIQPSWGFSIGNTKTLARVGLGFNWSATASEHRRLQAGGLDEGEFFVPDYNSDPTNGSILDALRHTVVYAQIQASEVLYNAFLEGNTFGGRSNIEPIRTVISSTVGFTIPLGENGQHKVGFALKGRSPEFKVRGEVNDDFYQTWGVISYSRDLDLF